MSKVKSVSQFNGTAWGTAVPLGADADNIDITSTTINPTNDDSSGLDSLMTDDVTVLAELNDTSATAWTKFNRLKRRVRTIVGNCVFKENIKSSYTSTPSSTTVYSTSAINEYINDYDFTPNFAPNSSTNGRLLRKSAMVRNNILYCSFIYEQQTSSTTYNSSYPFALIWYLQSDIVDNSVTPPTEKAFDFPLYCRHYPTANDPHDIWTGAVMSVPSNNLIMIFPPVELTLALSASSYYQVRGCFALPVKISGAPMPYT